MDVCDLGRTEVILEMPWLAAHNPEINWKTGEVKMTRCLPLCGEVKIKIKKKKERRVVTLEEEKIIRWAIDDKEDWRREEEIEEDHRKIQEMVPEKFLKWRKVFGKVESYHDLAKRLSYYLYFFSFLFLFFYLGLTI